MKLLSGQNIDAEVGSTIYRGYVQRCKEFDITPSRFGTCIEALVKISDGHHIPLPKIEDFLHERLDKKNKVERELENLYSKIPAAKNQMSEIEKAGDMALQQKKMADFEIMSYTNAKQVLDI